MHPLSAPGLSFTSSKSKLSMHGLRPMVILVENVKKIPLTYSESCKTGEKTHFFILRKIYLYKKFCSLIKIHFSPVGIKVLYNVALSPFYRWENQDTEMKASSPYHTCFREVWVGDRLQHINQERSPRAYQKGCPLAPVHFS